MTKNNLLFEIFTPKLPWFDVSYLQYHKKNRKKLKLIAHSSHSYWVFSLTMWSVISQLHYGILILQYTIYLYLREFAIRSRTKSFITSVLGKLKKWLIPFWNCLLRVSVSISIKLNKKRRILDVIAVNKLNFLTWI